MSDDRTCNICGCTEFIKEVYVRKFLYVNCVSCDTARVYPYPSEKELFDIYNNDYINIEEPNVSTKEHFKEENFKFYSRIMDMNFRDLNIKPSQFLNILDIGCAIGLFLDYFSMKNSKADIIGIDISNEMIEIAKSKGHIAKKINFIDFNENNNYDLITMWDVIEHLIDPVSYLNKSYKLLKLNGSIIIHTPCREILSKNYGEYWPHYIPPQHVHLFSQKGLFALVENCGFTIAGWTRFGSGIDKGKVPDVYKSTFDKVCKELGISDTIVIHCKKNKQ